MTFPLRIPTLVLILILLAGVFFLPSLDFPLLWDDAKVVRDNHHLRENTSALKFFSPVFWRQQVPISRNDYRPVQMLALRTIASAGGLDPAPYRAVNLILHSLVAFAIFILARHLSGDDSVALMALALFVVHPIHVEAVVNARNISELLSVLLMLIILNGMAQRPRGIKLAGLCLLYLVGILTKETALILPPLLTLIVWKKTTWKKAILTTLPFWILAAGGGGIKIMTMAANSGGRPGIYYLYPLELARLLGIYLRLLLFPFPLKTLYPFRVVGIWSQAVWVLPILGMAALILTLKKCRGFRGVKGWTGVALIISLLPALSKVAQMGRTVAEQRLYFPSVFYCILAGALVVSLFRKIPRRGKFAGGTALILIALSMIALGQQYLRCWQSEYTLWLRASILSPRASLAFNNLAIAYHSRHDSDSALLALKEALAINPEHCEAHNNMGVYLRKKGQWNKALEHFRRSLHSNPGYHIAALNMAEVQMKLGQPAQAQQVIQQVIDDNPHISEAYNALAIALERQGKVTKAIDAYKRSHKLNGEYAVPLRNLALLLQEEGRYEEALALTQKACRIEPRHPAGFSLLARLQVRKGNFEQARKLLIKGLRYNPGNRRLKSQLLALPPPNLRGK